MGIVGKLDCGVVGKLNRGIVGKLDCGIVGTLEGLGIAGECGSSLPCVAKVSVHTLTGWLRGEI